MDLLLADGVGPFSLSTPWILAIALLLVGLTLAMAEIFIPSGGILGFLATCAIIAAVFVGFSDERPWIGVAVMATAVVGLPGAAFMALKVWPHTPLGRRMLLDVPNGEDVLPDDPKIRSLADLVGRVGVAKSKMLPSGAVVIDGRTIDAVSEGMPIEAGQRVRVREVHGNRVVVRPVDEEAAPSGEPDRLAEPADSFGVDPLDPPPA